MLRRSSLLGSLLCISAALAGVGLSPTTHALPKRVTAGEVPGARVKPATPPPVTPLVRIPGGTHDVDTSRYTPDRAFPPAKIRTFALDKHEVTTAQYRHCVTSGACTAPRSGEPLRTFSDPQRQDHPVNFVSRAQARAYCAFVGRRLPTRWEWEWAAQGRDEERRFPWGGQRPERSELSSFACAHRGPVAAGRGTCPVMSVSKDRTRDGVFDMAGNVAEIVDTNVSVTGPLASVFRTKGATWLADTPNLMEAAMPHALDLNNHVGVRRDSTSINAMGFRCAKTLVPRALTNLPARQNGLK